VKATGSGPNDNGSPSSLLAALLAVLKGSGCVSFISPTLFSASPMIEPLTGKLPVAAPQVVSLTVAKRRRLPSLRSGRMHHRPLVNLVIGEGAVHPAP
jgi:hypothetical protein